MQYRKIPKTGEQISILGYGCMRLPTKIGKQYSSFIDTDKAERQIKHAIDRGVNYLDTAYPYHLGGSETFLGEYILNTSYRTKINIATKMPCYLINSKTDMEKYFEKQIKKLNIETIDYYLLHAIELRTYEKMVKLGIKEYLEELRKNGYIRNVGFSFHGRKDEFPKIIDDYDWDFTQVQYNILDENFQAGKSGIKYAASKGLGVFIMEPLRGGTLVNPLPKSIQNIYDTAPVHKHPAEWGLQWIANNPDITMILSGMNSLEQIDMNIDTLKTAFPDEMNTTELHLINTVKNEYNRLLKVKCTECGYCMPCPMGINIPAIFKNYNNYYLFSQTRAKAQHMIYSGFRTIDGEPHWADSCVKCGKCEKACPQKINIRDKLKSASKKLETPFYKTLAWGIRHITNKK